MIKQPGYEHVYEAFLNGAREARSNPEADDALFQRAADAWTKRTLLTIDPNADRRLLNNDWTSPLNKEETLASLRANIEELKEVITERSELNDRLSDLLTRTAIALKGPQPPGVRWGWHDLPEVAEQRISAVDPKHESMFWFWAAEWVKNQTSHNAATFHAFVERELLRRNTEKYPPEL